MGRADRLQDMHDSDPAWPVRQPLLSHTDWHPSGVRYILNSAVITAPGTYTYWIATDDLKALGSTPATWAAAWLADGPYQSTIGYAETAAALEVLCGLAPGTIPVHRVQITMEPGDEALVFRLVLPPGSPRIDPANKGSIRGHIEAGHWEVGLLRRFPDYR